MDRLGQICLPWVFIVIGVDPLRVTVHLGDEGRDVPEHSQEVLNQFRWIDHCELVLCRCAQSGSIIGDREIAMNAPHYFYAMFEKPNPPRKDMVELGVYHPDPSSAPFGAKAGDLLLLYCTDTYDELGARVPGLGVVVRADNECVEYRYLPFLQPVSKAAIERGFEGADGEKSLNRRFASFCFFEISRKSFTAAVGDRAVVWG